MTYREPANESPALVRPPQILGFAFYVLGTGCVAMGLAQLALFAENIHVAALAPLPSWAVVIGQVMVLLGLVIGWRATKGHQRRLLGVAATLWLTLFVLEMQRGRPSAASLVGRALVVLVVAVVVHTNGRAFASRTWATTLGATLVFADAWAGAWPVLTHASFRDGTARLLHAAPSMATGGIGLLLLGGGLYAAGRAILRGVTIEEYLRAHPPRRLDSDSDDGVPKTADVRTARLRVGLPLFADAAVSVAGLAVAHAMSVAASTSLRFSARDVGDTTTLGGELVAWTVLVVALRRMKPFTARPLTFALLAGFALGAQAALRYVAWASGVFASTGGSSVTLPMLPPVELARLVLVIATFFAVTTAFGPSTSASSSFGALQGRLRLVSWMLGGSMVASFVAIYLWTPSGRLVVLALGAVLGALSFYAAIGVARQARRIEIALIR